MGNLLGYLWNHALPGPHSDLYRAFHSSELPYVFGSYSAAPQRPFTVQDRAIGDVMMVYWSNFVKTGDPNGAEAPRWPEAHLGTPVVMELGDRFAPLAPLSPEVSKFFGAYFDRSGAFVF